MQQAVRFGRKQAYQPHHHGERGIVLGGRAASGQMNRDELAQFVRFEVALGEEYGLLHAPCTHAQSDIGAVGMAHG